MTVEPPRPPALTRPALAAVRSAVRVVLEREAGQDEPPWRLPASVPPAEFLQAVRRHRLVSMLATNQRHLDLPSPLPATLASAHQVAAVRNLQQIQQLLRAKTALHDAGVPVLAFKGPALAVQTTGDPAARGFGDIDLFVPHERLADAIRLLTAHGWSLVRQLPDQHSWAWSYMQRTAYEVQLTNASSRIDLHWRLDAALAGLPDFDECWSARAHVLIGGASVATLSPEHALLHSCSHAAKDRWTWLRSLVDVHRLMREVPDLAVLGRLPSRDRHTPAVVSHCIGVPAGVDRVARAASPRVQRVAYRRQTRPFVPDRMRHPGAGLARRFARQVTGSRRPGVWWNAFAASALPHSAFVGETSAHPATCVRRAVRRRIALVAQRLIATARVDR